MMKRLVAAVTALVAAASLTACGSDDAASADTLRVGTLSDSKPNAYQENGEFTGFDNELLKAIAEKQGLKLEFVATDFSALLGQVANGTFDIGSSKLKVVHSITTDLPHGGDASKGPFGALSDAVGLFASVVAAMPRKARSGHVRCPERRVGDVERPERAVRGTVDVSNAPFRTSATSDANHWPPNWPTASMSVLFGPFETLTLV